MKGIFLFFLTSLVASDVPKLTIEKLSEYDGTNGKVYIACSGLIFDVTSSPAYSFQGSYPKFPGKDVSAAVAKSNLNDEWLNVSITKANLTKPEKRSLENWKNYLIRKYPIVGELIDY